MKNLIFRAVFKKGAKGEAGEVGAGFVVPTGAIIAYDGNNIPEGYEDTTAPIAVDLTTKSITANGTYDATDDNADGYSQVIVNVQPNLTTKNITANGTYDATDDNADGYSQVNINISSRVTILTQSEYNALTQAQKLNGNVYLIKDSYEFYESNDGTIIIRIKSNEKKCFFKGFVQGDNYNNFPTELRSIWTANAPSVAYGVITAAYNENNERYSGRYVGFRYTSDWHINNCNGSWGDYGSWRNVKNWGVIDMLAINGSSVVQENVYTDPYDIPSGNDEIIGVYYMGEHFSLDT